MTVILHLYSQRATYLAHFIRHVWVARRECGEIWRPGKLQVRRLTDEIRVLCLETGLHTSRFEITPLSRDWLISQMRQKVLIVQGIE